MVLQYFLLRADTTFSFLVLFFVCRAAAGLPVPVSSEKKKSCQMRSIMQNMLFGVLGPNELTVTFILSAGHIMQ